MRCETADARAILAHHQPIAVMLEFVDPERAGPRAFVCLVLESGRLLRGKAP